MRTAHIGRFKPRCDFDWAWPKRCDRAAIDTLMTLEFLNAFSAEGRPQTRYIAVYPRILTAANIGSIPG